MKIRPVPVLATAGLLLVATAAGAQAQAQASPPYCSGVNADDLSALKLPQTVPELLNLARSEMKENNAENALAIIHSALEQEPKSTEAQHLLQEAEKEFVAQVYRNGFSGRAVPKLLHTREQLEHERLGPEEGFLLSRINGESDIESILSVCPFREADSLRMIKKLVDGGIIGINYIEVSASRNSHP